MGRLVRDWARVVVALLAMGFSVAAAEDASPPPPAVAAAATESAAPAGKQEVVVGAYVNDVQEIDFRTHSYTIDLYIWLRWRDAAFDPSASLEFMNRFAPSDHVRQLLYDKPKEMPDGSRYTVIRSQGRFSNKFRLEHYPFDTQRLTVIFEDSLLASGALTYVPDAVPVTVNPDIVLPGFRFGAARLEIVDKPYATNFGDLAEPEAPSYSRATLIIPITRPPLTTSLKALGPIILIVFCAGLVFFVRPSAVDGRIGLAITALLTLVALQLTGASSLPDVDYLMLIDRIYLISYIFIILALIRSVAMSWVEERSAEEVRVARRDKRWAMALGALYALVFAAIAATPFMQGS